MKNDLLQTKLFKLLRGMKGNSITNCDFSTFSNFCRGHHCDNSPRA